MLRAHLGTVFLYIFSIIFVYLSHTANIIVNDNMFILIKKYFVAGKLLLNYINRNTFVTSAVVRFKHF